jgi:cytidylate kinase
VLVRRQKEMGRQGGIVAEGRDTTTVVFPDAELKVFLCAGVEARAERRARELRRRGEEAGLDALMAQIRARDDRDRATQERTGPWPPADAVRLDTTGLSIEEQVEAVVSMARERVSREAR